MRDLTPFGRWLKQRRKALDITQAELARRVGCARITVVKIESGALHPSKQVAELLATALEIPIPERPAFIQCARTGELPAGPVAAPAARPAAGARPLSLPIPPTSFVGREAELAGALAMLQQPAVRLLTLTGPPGIGKTRLAAELAAAHASAFAHGVLFVALAPVAVPGRLAAAIAQAAGVQETPASSLDDALRDYLHDKELLLVLDNFEHLAGAAPRVLELLAGAPRVKALVTSRERLRVRGEHELRVPALDLPSGPQRRAPDPAAALARAPAVALFVDRARDASPDFALTRENAPAVAEICSLLDGIPLAIELAAARIRIFSPRQLLARLRAGAAGHAPRLQLLTRGPRDLPARQQTLRHAIAWSYELLTPAEQATFRQLGVFAGGCTLEAATAVALEDGERLAEPQMLDSLTALLEKSLLGQAPGAGDEPRFLMLETLREFALERLAEHGELAAARRRHLELFLELAGRAEIGLHTPECDAWLDRLEAEHPNLRAALEWCAAEPERAADGLELATRLTWFWYMRGYLSEGRAWLSTLLDAGAGKAADRVRAWALIGLSFLAPRQGRLAEARTLATDALALGRALDDSRVIAYALLALGDGADRQGDARAGRAWLEEALALGRAQGDDLITSYALLGLGRIAAGQGELEPARERFLESLQRARALGERQCVAWSLYALTELALLEEDLTAARGYLEEGLAIERAMGMKVGIANALDALGDLALREHDDAVAQEFFSQALVLRYELGHRVGAAQSTLALAALAGRRGQPERAAELFGAAEALRETTGARLAGGIRLRYEAELEAVSAALGEPACSAARLKGRRLSPEQVVQLAGAVPEP